MSKHVTNEDLDLLGELGLDHIPAQTNALSPRQQRIIAGFEEIQQFFAKHNRLPQHGENLDIFERIYAARLDAIRESTECCELLKNLDIHHWLPRTAGPATDAQPQPATDNLLLDALGIAPPASNDITLLQHVRSRDEINAAEEIAQRKPCKDFEKFKPLFETVQLQLDTGDRKTLKYENNAEIEKDDLFILDGQKVLVADLGDTVENSHGRPDRRLRVIFDNAMESDLLLRSLQRALNKDKSSRRIQAQDFGPLFASFEEKDDITSGWIYVLRSKSNHPFVVQNKSTLHKIGVTTSHVKTRIANAKIDPTFLLADVETVLTYKIANLDCKLLEAKIHKFFGSTRLDLELKDRFGFSVEPKEWFLVPLAPIEEAVERFTDGSIVDYLYDPKSATLKKR